MKNTEENRFQVDLRGLIELLSKHLYTTARVFIRELLQNAVDALTAKRLAGLADGDEGIVVSCPSPGVLVFEDDGIGLDEEEVHQFLATIGQSSKRLAESMPESDDFLGRFGIGLLACFMVSDEVEVLTRSAKEGGKTLRWLGSSDGRYLLEPGEPKEREGTTVIVRAREDCLDLVDPQAVRESLRHYGAFLPHKIELAVSGERERIDEPPPWQRDFESASEKRQAVMELGERFFGMPFFDYILLKDDRRGIEGIAYVLPRATRGYGRRSDRFYLKGMLLTETGDNLLPDWAFFTKCVVNVHGLRPLASREGFFEDLDLADTRDCLGQTIRSYLVGLSQTDPERLHMLIALHHLPIKMLAAEDRDFLPVIWRWIPFETSAGVQTLEEYTANHDALRYAATVDEFRQVAPLVEARGECVLNAGHAHEQDLLLHLSSLLPGHRLEKVRADTLVERFDDLSLHERELAATLLHVTDLVLQPFRCHAQAKHFSPHTLPALYSASDDATFVRTVEQTKKVASDLWSGVLEQVASQRIQSGYATLTYNFDNPMVHRLARVDDRELLRRLIEVLYLQTLLLGHHPMSMGEMQLANESINGLILWSLDQGGKGFIQ